MAKKAVIFGGAGFLGSHIAERMVADGWAVTVVDGLVAGTGGAIRNLRQIQDCAEIVDRRVEEVPNLHAMLSAADLAIDAMAWTAHLLALERPRFDLELNASSHLVLLEALRHAPGCHTIFLGSTGQYGNVQAPVVCEDTPMLPVDIQGIHKVAAESYFRVFAAVYGVRSISLRVSNCFGERQPFTGRDIGLVGSFIRDALAGRTIEVYGDARRRTLCYVGDVAEIVCRCATRQFAGFQAFNTGGHRLPIAEIARTVTEVAGSGSCVVKAIPETIRAIDAGGAEIDNRHLIDSIGPIRLTDFRTAVARTISSIRNEIEPNLP